MGQNFLPFLRLNNIPLYVHTTFYLSCHPWMDIRVASTSWALQVVLLRTWLCKSLFKDPAFNSFGYIPRSGIPGPYDSSIFNFLRNHHAANYYVHSFVHLTIHPPIDPCILYPFMLLNFYINQNKLGFVAITNNSKISEA